MGVVVVIRDQDCNIARFHGTAQVNLLGATDDLHLHLLGAFFAGERGADLHGVSAASRRGDHPGRWPASR
jgi:hypothetical protein